MLLSTTDNLPGATITVTLGMVVGAVPYFGSTYAEGIKSLDGATHPDVSIVLERRRQEALERLGVNARRLGASAVVGVRFTSREITGTWKEVCAYGTAVVIEGDS